MRLGVINSASAFGSIMVGALLSFSSDLHASVCGPEAWARLGSLYQGQRGLVVDSIESLRTLTYRNPRGKMFEFEVLSGPAELNSAIQAGLVNLHRPGLRVDLEPGVYTYVVFRDGSLVTGLKLDSFEMGVKHLNLANHPEVSGIEIVAGGELRVGNGGAYEWNARSGNITRVLTEHVHVPMPGIERRTRELLQTYLGRGGDYRRYDFAAPQPSREQLRAYCSWRDFYRRNPTACCEAVGVGPNCGASP